MACNDVGNDVSYFFWAAWPVMHSNRLIAFIKLLIFLFIAYKVIDTPKKFEWMIWIYLVGNFYIGWVAHGIGRTGYGRLEGIGPSDSVASNDCAAAIVTSIPFYFFIF